MFSLVCVIIFIGVGVCMPGPRFLLSGWVRLISCPFQGGWEYTAGVAIPEGWGGVSIPEGAVPEVVGGRYTNGWKVYQRVCIPTPSQSWDLGYPPPPSTGHHSTYGWQAGSTNPNGMMSC